MDLNKIVWAAALALRNMKIGDAMPVKEIDDLRKVCKAGQHVGNRNMVEQEKECVEWYGGQILDVIDSRKYFAMNSILNCAERFLPPQQ